MEEMQQIKISGPPLYNNFEGQKFVQFCGYLSYTAHTVVVHYLLYYATENIIDIAYYFGI